MTKNDLIEMLSEKAELPKNASALVVNTLLDALASTLSAGGKVELRGFGSFRLKVREARSARNPKTGEKVRVQERAVPVFRAGKELKEAVNGGKGDLPDEGQ